MKTKLLFPILIAGAAVFAVICTTGCNKSETPTTGAKAVQYTCSMHPEVVKDQPGNCPKCNMPLIEKR